MLTLIFNSDTRWKSWSEPRRSVGVWTAPPRKDSIAVKLPTLTVTAAPARLTVSASARARVMQVSAKIFTRDAVASAGASAMIRAKPISTRTAKLRTRVDLSEDDRIAILLSL